MYFQIIDNNSKCKKVYASGDLCDYYGQSTMSKTWKHSVHLIDREDVDYAYLYVDGDINKVGSTSWLEASSRVSAIMKTVSFAKCDLDNSCIYDYIPDDLLVAFLSAKEQIIKKIFESIDKPSHYDILKKAHILTEEMNSRLNLFNDELKRTNYNVFGTKTGRLSNAQSGIPILTLKKEDRASLKPRNDLFVELDFNAAELRTLLALGDKEQPEQDIHDWNMQQFNKEGMTREEVKKRTFAWLYNPEASDSLLESLYDRHAIKDKYKTATGLRTPFFREIETEDRKVLNYLVQSTSSDVCIEQCFKLREFFKECKTKISYLLHDSVILDYSKEDRDKLIEAKNIFSNTRFGKYRVNASIGKDFGNMKRIF